MISQCCFVEKKNTKGTKSGVKEKQVVKKELDVGLQVKMFDWMTTELSCALCSKFRQVGISAV